MRNVKKEFNWEGITFPTKVKDINIWETNNSININLFGFDDEAKKIYTIKMGELKNPLETINLFLHDDNHYCVVKDLSRLVSSQLSKKEHAKHLCLGCPTKTILKTASYEGEDMRKTFVDAITEEAKIIYEKVYKNPKPMVTSEEGAKQHTKAKNCYACGIEFGTYITNAKGEKTKVTSCRDHCHITGKYRGAACDKCNLGVRVPKFVPVLFHSLEGYDSHLFVKSLGLTKGDIKCIPKTDERYISFSKMIPVDSYITSEDEEKTIYLELRFMNSLKFTLKSLDSLAKTLGDDQFETFTCQMIPLIPKETDDGGKHNRIESLNILKQKRVFPYEYMTDFSKLSATSLPPKEAFYSLLSGSGISDKDYAHAQNVWNAFNCKIMRDYHDLYLKTDTLLLADVMTEFRRTCEKAYGLEALYYYTSPGLAWDAMLKITKVKLDLISDPNMYLMIEKWIRGGVSNIMKRKTESNHKYLDDHDSSKPSKFIEYLDANNLYGWAMSQKLPVRNLRWMDLNELEN